MKPELLKKAWENVREKAIKQATHPAIAALYDNSLAIYHIHNRLNAADILDIGIALGREYARLERGK